MIIEYTGRQVVVTQKYKDQAKAGIQRITRIINGATSAKVVLTVDKYRKIADVTVSQGSQHMVAACESAEMKIEQQAVRQKQKTTAGKRHPRPLETVDGLDGPAAAAASA